MILNGFQKQIKRGNCAPVKVAVIRQSGGLVESNCGWTFLHRREKVREAAIDRHLTKHHGGQGLRL